MLPPQPFDLLETDEYDDVLVVRIRQTHLLDDTPQTLKREIACLLEDTTYRTFILDLSDVVMVASEAVGVLVGLQSRSRKRGAMLILAGLRARVVEVFHLCNLISTDPASGVFATHPSAATALAAIRSAA